MQKAGDHRGGLHTRKGHDVAFHFLDDGQDLPEAGVDARRDPLGSIPCRLLRSEVLRQLPGSGAHGNPDYGGEGMQPANKTLLRHYKYKL